LDVVVNAWSEKAAAVPVPKEEFNADDGVGVPVEV
jgi:hypothetical protein